MSLFHDFDFVFDFFFLSSPLCISSLDLIDLSSFLFILHSIAFL